MGEAFILYMSLIPRLKIETAFYLEEKEIWFTLLYCENIDFEIDSCVFPYLRATHNLFTLINKHLQRKVPIHEADQTLQQLDKVTKIQVLYACY